MSQEDDKKAIKQFSEEHYEYGFHDDIKPIFSTGVGLTEETVREATGLWARFNKIRFITAPIFSTTN